MKLRPLKTVLTSTTYFKGTFKNSGHGSGVHDLDRSSRSSTLFSLKWPKTKEAGHRGRVKVYTVWKPQTGWNSPGFQNDWSVGPAKALQGSRKQIPSFVLQISCGRHHACLRNLAAVCQPPALFSSSPPNLTSHTLCSSLKAPPPVEKGKDHALISLHYLFGKCAEILCKKMSLRYAPTGITSYEPWELSIWELWRLPN